MEIIQICPQCGIPSIAVNERAVRFNLTDTAKRLYEPDLKWSICNNSQCDVSYFSKKQDFKISDLIRPLFFKDFSDAAPICYCSDLTRGEIKNAVKKGNKTIDEVQQHTHKDTTGFCEERNPLGKCCRSIFLKTISDSIDY